MHLLQISAFLVSVMAVGSTQPATGVQCITVDSVAKTYVERALALANTVSQHRLHFAAFDSGQVMLVRDSAVCQRVARGYGIRDGRVRKDLAEINRLVVVRLGAAGYLVHVPTDVFSAGEFVCDVAILDARFRYRSHMCG